MRRAVAIVGLTGLAVLGFLFWRSHRKPSRPKVILIGLDGASWITAKPLMDAGKLPHLRELMSRGAWGSLESLSPTASPRIWTSIATGKAPRKHGIANFTYRMSSGAQAPVHQGRRTCKAVWDILGENGIRVAIVNWWVTWPVHPLNGIMVSDRMRMGERPEYPKGTLAYPPQLVDELLPAVDPSPAVFEREGSQYEFPVEWLRTVAPKDEQFAKMKGFFPVYFAHEQSVRKISRILWNHEWDFFGVIFRMIDVSSHTLQFQLDLDALAASPDKDEVWKQFTKALEPAWLYSDAILGEFLERFPDATFIIVSDHGFSYQGLHFGHGTREEGPAPGIFVGTGRGFRAGAADLHCSVLDVTPTLLRLYGIPPAVDMDGRIIEKALDPAALPHFRISRPDSYDKGWTNPVRDPEAEESKVMEDLRALGYVQ